MTQQFHFWVFTQRKHNKFEKIYVPVCVHCSISYNSQDMDEARCLSTDEWIDKMRYIFIFYIYLSIYLSNQNGILFGSQEKESLPFVTTWTNLDNITLSGRSRTEKGKQRLLSFMSGV